MHHTRLLQVLYPKLSVGGYTIVDDYGTFAECRQAVHDYLEATSTQVDLYHIASSSMFWQKHD